MEPLDWMEQLVRQAFKVRLEQPVLQVSRVKLEQLVPVVYKVMLERLVHQDLRVQQDHKDHKDHRDRLVPVVWDLAQYIPRPAMPQMDHWLDQIHLAIILTLLESVLLLWATMFFCRIKQAVQHIIIMVVLL
jgi:hypothetical protein